MTDEVIKGADKLLVLSKQLKAMGNKDLQKELTKGINAAFKPLKRELPQSARNTLPRKGGLNEKVAALKFTVSRRKSNNGQGLKLIARNKISIKNMDDPGRVRHPVFARDGKPRVWVDQKITPGWATKPFEADAKNIRNDIEVAMHRVIAKIDGKGGVHNA